MAAKAIACGLRFRMLAIPSVVAWILVTTDCKMHEKLCLLNEPKRPKGWDDVS